MTELDELEEFKLAAAKSAGSAKRIRHGTKRALAIAKNQWPKTPKWKRQLSRYHQIAAVKTAERDT